MANPHRGEVELKAGDKTYTLVFDINSVCELEGMLDKGINDIAADMSRISVVRAVLWAGLRAHHKMSIEEAGALMQTAGANATGEAISKAMALAFPEGDGKKGSGKNPR